MCDALGRGCGWSQTIGLTQIGGGFCFKPLVWPESGSGFASNHWFDPNRRSVLLQTIGLTRIGGRFRFKPLVWPQSGSGFASNHWFDPNRGRVLHQTTWFDPNRGRVLHQTTWFGPNRGRVLHQTTWLGPIAGAICIKPPGLTPSTPRKALVFSVRYSFRAGVRQGSPCRWRTRRR